MNEEQQIFEAGSAAYTVALPSGGFEGPLDLLLHLCQKHELDILDIPISFVTARYLEYISLMQLIQLDVAAEYLVMAATLAHIKSKMLLPAPPPGQEDDNQEEEEDPRAALIARLLAYQKYKRAGEDLSARGVTGRDAFVRGTAIAEAVQSGIPPLADIPLYRLVEAFQAVVSRSKVKLTHDIVADRISITDRIHQLTDVLRVLRRTTFENLFDGVATPFDLVITFLALLEMSRLKMTRLFQPDPLSTIWVELADSFAADGDIGGEFEENQRTEEAPEAAAAMASDGEGQTDAPPPAHETEAPQALDTEAPPDMAEAAMSDGLMASELMAAEPTDGSMDEASSGQDSQELAERTEVSSHRDFDEQADAILEDTQNMPSPDGDTPEGNEPVDDGA